MDNLTRRIREAVDEWLEGWTVKLPYKVKKGFPGGTHPRFIAYRLLKSIFKKKKGLVPTFKLKKKKKGGDAHKKAWATRRKRYGKSGTKQKGKSLI